MLRAAKVHIQIRKLPYPQGKEIAPSEVKSPFEFY